MKEEEHVPKEGDFVLVSFNEADQSQPGSSKGRPVYYVGFVKNVISETRAETRANKSDENMRFAYPDEVDTDSHLVSDIA